MRYQLYIYKSSDGFVRAVIRDTEKSLGSSGSVLLRDQSSYPEDNCKMVWKNAAFPVYIMCDVRESNGFVIAFAEDLQFLSADFRNETVNRIWESTR